MIYKMSLRFADWIIKHHPDYLKEYDVFVYVFQCLIESFIANGILIIIAFIIGMPIYALIWIIFYHALRVYIGGNHAETFLGCVLGGTFFSVVNILAIPYLSKYSLLLLFETGLSIFVTFFFAPVIHPNRLVSESVKKKRHTKAKIIVFVESGLVALFYLIFEHSVAHSAALGMLTASILCIVGKYTNKKAKD